MRSALTVLGFCMLGLTGNAFAQTCPCPGSTRLNQIELAAALGSRTVCALVDGQVQQKHHSGGSTGGPLVAYKRGPGHAVDPSETVGTWSILGTGANTTVRYNYSGGTQYEYSVCGAAGGPYTYCGATGSRNFANITTRAGAVACQ